MPKARVSEGRSMLATLLDALEERAADPKKQRSTLRAAVVAFNRWNDTHGVIETAEREALFAVLVEVGTAAGLDDAAAVTDDARDW